MIKTLRVFILILFLFNNAIGQAPLWVNSIISSGYDDCNDLYSDQSGNVYVTGQIEFTASFDGFKVSSNGSHDIFIAKYDSSGNLIWAKHAGGSDGDIGKSIAVDSIGNVYVTGEFESKSNFGGISKTAQGPNDMFIAKYDSSGNSVWVKSIGNNLGSTIGYAIACDAEGNVYASGTFRSKAYFNGSTLATSRGEEDIILIKFNSDGTYDWHKQIGGSGSDHGFGLAIKGDKLYVTGSFENTARFTSSFSLHDDGGKDFFLAQYDTNGSFMWAQAGGGGGDDIGYDVTVNTNGAIVCSGEFRGHGTFGSNSINSKGSSDMFVVAYDADGQNLWARNAGGDEIDLGNKISNDNNGNLFIGGSFSEDATFDQTIISSNGDEDVFLASYDSIGNFRFVKGFGGRSQDRGHGTGADKYGNIYFSGEFRNNINFESFNIDGSSLYDGFIVRFGNLPCLIEIDSSIVTSATCLGCNDGFIDISISGGIPPYNFEWSDSSNSEDRINLMAGMYSVCITDANGCFLCDTFNLINVPLGIKANFNNSMIHVYPNPVQSQITIYFNNGLPIEKFHIELNSSLAKKLKTIPVISNTTCLSMTEFPNGIYFLKIINTETGETIKIKPLLLQR